MAWRKERSGYRNLILTISLRKNETPKRRNAETPKRRNAETPKHTVGLRLDLDDRNGNFYLTDLVLVRKPPGAVEQLVAATAQLDGKAVRIIIEQEPGAAGRTVTDRYKRHVLRGYSVRGERATGAKDVRASVAAAAAENGLIKIVRGRNTNEFLDELTAFPHAPHDDCVGRTGSPARCRDRHHSLRPKSDATLNPSDTANSPASR